MEWVTILDAKDEYSDIDITADKEGVSIYVGNYMEGCSYSLTRAEAIAAARAILKHFNALDDDDSYRYRAPTDEEMAKFLAENPNYKLIPKEAYDPDAPLTSELAQNFGEE